MIHGTTVVLAEHEIHDVDLQVRVPDMNELPPRQNPDHPAEPLKWKAKNLGEEEGCLAKMTEHPDFEIAPPQRKLEIYTLV